MSKIKDFFKSRWGRLFIIAPILLQLSFIIVKYVHITLYIAENYDIESELFIAGAGAWWAIDMVFFASAFFVLFMFKLIKLLIDCLKEDIKDFKEFIKNRKEKN